MSTVTNTPLPPERRLATTYGQARREVLSAATSARAPVTSHPHPRRGREGEELAIDVVTVGPAAADAVVLIVSGTHGVEGYAGSALERWWLDERAAAVPAGVRVVIVHALNPFGFSWVRRVNEDNVDLNRNFVDWTRPPPDNRAYGELADLLVPAEWSEERRSETTSELVETAVAIGLATFQEVVTSGQYDHPAGIYYGGREPVWSHTWAVEHLPGLVGTASRLAVIDLHTGLGPWGQGELITHEAVGAPAYARGTAWWGEVRSSRGGESLSAVLSGDWRTAVARWMPDVEVTAVALEFGTVDALTVLQALRADAWLHEHGDPRAAEGDAIRAQVRVAFADDDPAWLAALIQRFDEVATAAIGALS